MTEDVKEISLDLRTTPFNLNHTLSCGQTFRWENHRNWWHGVAQETLVKIRQIGDVIRFQTFPRSLDDTFIWSYFRLDDDLPYIYSKIEKDKHIKKAIRKFCGLRLIRQDPWECLISYICATNKNIPAIKDIINNMCTRFGEKKIFEDMDFYTFPKPHELAEAQLKKLRLCKLGFRAERVKQISNLVINGKLNLEALKKTHHKKAKKELMKLPGVGPKVADCVLLFSLNKLEAFPIDVWIRRAILEFYREHLKKSFLKKIETKKSLSPNEYEVLSSFGRRYFGEYIGYAQEYLFQLIRCR